MDAFDEVRGEDEAAVQEHCAFDDEHQREEGEDQEQPDERTGVEREGEAAAHWGLVELDDESRKVASLLSAVDWPGRRDCSDG